MNKSLHYASITRKVMVAITNDTIALPVLVLILIQITNVSTANEDGKKISWKGVEGLNVDRTLSPNVTEDCLSNGLCVRVSNYPTKIATWALVQLSKRGLRGVVEKTYQHPKSLVILYTACEIPEEILFPRAAQSIEGEWNFILNLDRKLYQGFYTNICSSQECPRLKEASNSECEQKYTLRPMIYLDIRNEMVAEKLFKVPNLCKCVFS